MPLQKSVLLRLHGRARGFTFTLDRILRKRNRLEQVEIL